MIDFLPCKPRGLFLASPRAGRAAAHREAPRSGSLCPGRRLGRSPREHHPLPRDSPRLSLHQLQRGTARPCAPARGGAADGRAGPGRGERLRPLGRRPRDDSPRRGAPRPLPLRSLRGGARVSDLGSLGGREAPPPAFAARSPPFVASAGVIFVVQSLPPTVLVPVRLPVRLPLPFPVRL